MNNDLPAENDEHYLGDGLYVKFDGYQLVLRAPRLTDDHFVALDPFIWRALRDWVAGYPLLKEHLAGGELRPPLPPSRDGNYIYVMKKGA